MERDTAYLTNKIASRYNLHILAYLGWFLLYSYGAAALLQIIPATLFEYIYSRPLEIPYFAAYLIEILTIALAAGCTGYTFADRMGRAPATLEARFFAGSGVLIAGLLYFLVRHFSIILFDGLTDKEAIYVAEEYSRRPEILRDSFFIFYPFFLLFHYWLLGWFFKIGARWSVNNWKRRNGEKPV